jgi:hypothetical protein
MFYPDFKRLSTDPFEGLFESCHLISFSLAFKVTLCLDLLLLNTDTRHVTRTNMQTACKVTGIYKSLGRI